MYEHEGAVSIEPKSFAEWPQRGHAHAELLVRRCAVSGRRRFGAIRKLPSGRWQVRFRDPETDRYRTAAQTFTTKTEAGRWLSVLEADMTRGHWHDRGAATSRSARSPSDGTQPSCISARRPSTSTGRLLDRHILPTFADEPIGSITTLAVQMWISDRSANTRMGANSVAKTYKVLRAVMESALDAELIVRNPCRDQRCRNRTPTRDALRHIRASRRTRRSRRTGVACTILLAAYSGLRWGELAGLRRRYVDPLHKTVRVVEQCTQVGGHFVWGPPKTSAGTRTVVLPDFIVDIMIEHLAQWSEPGREGLVFVMAGGTPLRRENFRRRVWLPACEAVGVEGLRFHDLRHTNATLAAASGAPLRAVMHRLGHHSAAAAIRYQHQLAGQDASIAEYLEKVGRSAGET